MKNQKRLHHALLPFSPEEEGEKQKREWIMIQLLLTFRQPSKKEAPIPSCHDSALYKHLPVQEQWRERRSFS